MTNFDFHSKKIEHEYRNDIKAMLAQITTRKYWGFFYHFYRERKTKYVRTVYRLF